MKRKLTQKAFFSILKKTAQNIPDHRNLRAPNWKHPIERALFTAFAAFFFQQPSLLAHEKKLERTLYRNNFKRLFHDKPIDCSQSVRTILDPISPEALMPAFDNVFHRMDRSALFQELKFDNQLGLLFAGDGVDYFYSEEISCANCSIARHKKDGEIIRTSYSHKMFNVGIVHPTKNYFIPLFPEFISPQDGAKKQDCEQVAARRWIQSFRKRHKTIQVTMQFDALFCNHEFLSYVLKHRLHFVATCKPKSTPTLYEWIETARQGGDIHIVEERKKVKGKFVLFQYEYLNGVPIRDTEDALRVNYVSIKEIDPVTQTVQKKFEYVTDHKVNEKNVAKIILAGRKRWKVENEGNNTLKNQGYYFDHNYGHGKQYLSAIIATLILYSFQVHVILRIISQDPLSLILKESHSRRGCFELLRGIMDSCIMINWEELYIFSMKALEKG